MSTKTETLPVDGYDDAYIVEYTYQAGSPGRSHNKHGDPGDAPEGDDIELVSVKLDVDELGPDILDELTDEQKSSLIESIQYIEADDHVEEEDEDEDYRTPFDDLDEFLMDEDGDDAEDDD
jgi:hypothetical protein